MPAALTSFPLRAGAFSLVTAVFGAGLAAITEFTPATDMPVGGAPVFEVVLFSDAGSGQASVAETMAQPRQDALRETSAVSHETAQTKPRQVLSSSPAPSVEKAMHSVMPLGQQSSPPDTVTRSDFGAGQAFVSTRETTGDSRKGRENSGARNADLIDEYEATVIRWIERHKRHPGHMYGMVTLVFKVDRRGRMRDCLIARSSGDSRLDQAALAQITAAAPFPRPPHNVTWQTRQMQVRLDYRSPM